MGLPPTKEKNLKPQNVGPTPLSLVIFQCGIVSHKRKKNPKPQNVGPTPLSLVIFQCGIVSHKRKKILSLKIWGLQICPSSIEFMSVTNMNNEVKRKCEK